MLIVMPSDRFRVYINPYRNCQQVLLSAVAGGDNAKQMKTPNGNGGRVYTYDNNIKISCNSVFDSGGGGNKCANINVN